MSKKWCHNAYTGEIFSYNVYNDGKDTTFSKGQLYAYGDYLTTNFSSKEQAIEWSKKYGKCKRCDTARPVDENGNCKFCGTKIEFKEVIINE